jgi:hypothetical protein
MSNDESSKDIFEQGWSEGEIFRFLIDVAGWDPEFAGMHINAHYGRPLGDRVGYSELMEAAFQKGVLPRKDEQG